MYALVAVALGLVVGLASGGRFTNVASRPFRSAWLLIVGIVLQAVTEAFHLPRLFDVAAVLVSYGSLAGFALRNLNLSGMGLVALGLLLNILPIAVNGGMPVRAKAIVEAGIVRDRSQVHTLHFGGKRHLERSTDHLIVLSDILPDWVFHEVLSFGDLVMSLGIAAVLVNLLHAEGRRRAVHSSPAHLPTAAADRSPPAGD